ncbi:MAG: ArsC family reductase [Pseudomonadales bacterium]
MITLYGIKNCDSVKKAKRWLDTNTVNYRFHDFRINGLEPQLLNDWIQRIQYTVLLNTRSRTWKELSMDERDNLNQEKALRLMLKYPTLIKRPVMDTGKELLVGFSEQSYSGLF